MIGERLRPLILQVKTLFLPRKREVTPGNCILFYDRSQVIQYSTFNDAREKEQITRELEVAGANILGVSSVEEALRRSRSTRLDFNLDTPFRNT